MQFVVYLRVKKVKSTNYLYLVKSTWNKSKNTSKQEIVKYLGKASNVTPNDIPPDYRDDPNLITALDRYTSDDTEFKDNTINKSCHILYEKLLEGNIQESEMIYQEYSKLFGISDFLENILRPVMYRIGDDWHHGRISIASEHVASNIAQTLIRRTIRQTPSRKNKKKILVCVPSGEEHHLGCDILESVLTGKGFRVFNMSAPLPTESLLNFIQRNTPDCILVSITLDENLRAGQNMVTKIRQHYDIPIFVGGHAVQSSNVRVPGAEVLSDVNLTSILRKIKRAGS